MDAQNRSYVAVNKLLMLSILITLFLSASGYVVSLDETYLPKGVIRITSDGTIIGTSGISQNGKIYTITEDLNGDVAAGFIFISIECNGIIFDGAGKTIQGTNNGVAIVIYGNNVTIKNVCIVNFGTGIEVGIHTLAANNYIVDNYFETRYWSIALRGVKEFVSGNTFNSKNGRAIDFWTDETTFTNNKFIDCGLILHDHGVSNVISGNTINGKPLVFLEGQSNQVIDGANQVLLVNCKNMVVQNVVNIGLDQPIHLIRTTDTIVTNCKAHITLDDSGNNLLFDNEFSKTGGTWQNAAVKLSNSNYNMITQNSITGIDCCGIMCTSSGYNRIEKNTVSFSGVVGNACSGISLDGSCNNYVYENNITSEEYGITFSTADYNVVFNNNIYKGTSSAHVMSSFYNDVFGNNFSGASNYAILLMCSDFNNFYWNNFKGNTQIYEIHEMYSMTLTTSTFYAEYNKWDNGKEGNFWSDYPGQDNGEGIGKTPHKVYETFTDNYPLIQPYNTPEIQITFTGWTDSTAPEYSILQQPKNFPLMYVLVVISVVAIVVSAICLWRLKNKPKAKLT